MLNPFPELLAWSGLAPFVLRLALGFLFINLGFLKLTKEKARWESFFKIIRVGPADFLTKLFGFIEIIGGIALVIGLYTQIAALIFAILTFVEVYLEYKEESLLERTLPFYILIFAISLSLIFSGAGLLAFDLPL
ncbi:MAG: hypothetical protein A2653_01955 [Candidatus Zambryskibacteria bacterium RIFCSPHIGHO2_01_FULL_43_25]|uniref:DoxX family protein n=1 Tax=Candidatus Zambryskibacteria bacterium RIFCSPLOWO2_01_FULL_45_21 TaxID=1802761 RepID=A0A1G2U4A4_9BACT|nr:MAG: hypothetical protein A2653_01955 [Candidatus Zambryskibacteria bacterium RIFCSPHIGHO2_01_FULL_43_25]OHB00738.1 MAG: hypothetical protein A3E94_02840 [Candidatus Zambryskibacteria bacterium RIFCSPHIGHO2_12_FULL_44_12b]OHB04334.1 MAG: hypothetical protein A3B14_02595 [Candidatus Zambryskibacteria bacterium RIFCSPLOWO2_01_FULL_45_21]